MDDFIVVKRKRRSHKTYINNTQLTNIEHSLSFSLESVTQKLEENRYEVRNSEFHKMFLDSFKKCLKAFSPQDTSIVPSLRIQSPVERANETSSNNTNNSSNVSAKSHIRDGVCEKRVSDCTNVSIHPHGTEQSIQASGESCSLCRSDDETEAGGAESRCGKTEHDALPQFDKMICYGLGKLSCVTARYQLAFFRCLQQDLKLEAEHCLFYDPHFDQDDISALQHLGHTILMDNEEGKHPVNGELCLFFLPHCGKALYNNLLWSNWSLDSITRMVVIGNSFHQMIDSLPPSHVLRHMAYVSRMCEYTIEEAISNTFRYTDIFNDFATHVFPLRLLSKAPSKFWVDNVEPTYDSDDLEIVVRQST